MVRYSSKQQLLNSISCALEVSIRAETEQLNNRITEEPPASDEFSIDSSSDDDSSSSIDSAMDLDSSSDSSSYSSSDSDDDHPLPLSQGLIRMYVFVLEQRYTVPRQRSITHLDRLIDILDRSAVTDHQLFRGLVRMSPEAFDKLALRLQQTETFKSRYGHPLPLDNVQEVLSVGLYRLGRSGNGGGERDSALQCGCSVGSLIGWTDRTISALLELNSEVMTFATEAERRSSAAWVQRKTGVEEWSKGWLVVDGSHIRLAWEPSLLKKEHFNYKGFPSINIAVVILPHSLRIVEYVVGHPGSVQDSKVWVTGSNILKKPRLYLDEGKFIWVDGGYGHSGFTAGPFSHIAASKSRDLAFYNYTMSRVRVRVEHALAYLKNRFQCLNGYRGNIYRTKDRITAAQTIQACIIAHTFASRYDRPDNIADLLIGLDLDDTVISQIATSSQLSMTELEDIRANRRANQQQYEEDSLAATQSLTASARSRYHNNLAHSLREHLFQSLFRSSGREPQDTSFLSRRQEKTVADYERDTAASTSSRPFDHTQASTATTQQ